MFHFTIRELVLLTLVVGMGIAWWLDRRQLSDSHVRASDKLELATRENESLRAFILEAERMYEQDTGNGLTIELPNEILTRD